MGPAISRFWGVFVSKRPRIVNSLDPPRVGPVILRFLVFRNKHGTVFVSKRPKIVKSLDPPRVGPVIWRFDTFDTFYTFDTFGTFDTFDTLDTFHTFDTFRQITGPTLGGSSDLAI